MEREKIRNMAESIYRAGTRLSRLVENYLLYAQLELVDVKSEKINQLKKFLATNPAYPASTIRRQAEEKAQELGRSKDLVLDLDDVSVQVSAEDIRKIAEELVDNAFKFSEPGTLVHIQMKADRQAFYLTVSDQGRGMTQETMDRIAAYVQFDRKIFEQQGAGLGLSIARRLVDLNQGKLTLDSEHDRGTTVHVTFPVI
jgi:signal transduction histidine kinase